jgi:integrase
MQEIALNGSARLPAFERLAVEREMAWLTNRVLEAKPGERDLFIWDDELRGFGIHVYPSGARTYLLQWKRDRRTRRLVLGAHGPTICEQARAKATVLLGRVGEGEDPAEERDTRRRDLTLAEFLELYLAEGAGHLWPITNEVYRSAFERHVKPLLGSRKLASLRQADIVKLQDDIANGRSARTLVGKAKPHGRIVVRGGRGIAARMRQYLGAALSWGVKRGLLQENPASGVKKFKTRSLDRHLNRDEFSLLGEALAAAEAAGANAKFVRAVRLLPPTGCRKSEITRLRWSEVDIAAAVLRLADTKTGAKILPLSLEAALLLGSIERHAGSAWMIPAARGEASITGITKFFAGLCRGAGLERVTLHTLRHSLASTAATSGASLFLVGRALGHADVATTARYAHVQVNPVAQVVESTSSVIAAAMRDGAARFNAKG